MLAREGGEAMVTTGFYGNFTSILRFVGYVVESFAIQPSSHRPGFLKADVRHRQSVGAAKIVELLVCRRALCEKDPHQSGFGGQVGFASKFVRGTAHDVAAAAAERHVFETIRVVTVMLPRVDVVRLQFEPRAAIHAASFLRKMPSPNCRPALALWKMSLESFLRCDGGSDLGRIQMAEHEGGDFLERHHPLLNQEAEQSLPVVFGPCAVNVG